jgi:hypothetical protein
VALVNMQRRNLTVIFDGLRPSTGPTLHPWAFGNGTYPLGAGIAANAGDALRSQSRPGITRALQ